MRGMVTLTLLAVILAGMLDAPPARAQATVTVDCASGDLVADALTSTAPELTVRIIGICAEDFEVTRDDVLFRGANPANDGFSWGGGDGSEVAFATVLVREARNIRFERLGFFDGSRNGLGVENTNSVEVDRCRFQNNERGIGASDSIVLVTDTVFVGNNLWDFGAFQGSFIDCTGCTTSGSQFSVLASSGGSVNVGGGTIEGNWGAVATGNGSSMFLDGTDITAASMGLSVERNAQMFVTNTTLDHAFQVVDDALLDMDGVTQTANPIDLNFINMGSTVRLRVSTSATGDTLLWSGAHLTIEDGAQLDGLLSCGKASDAYCEDPLLVLEGTVDCDACVSAAVARTPARTAWEPLVLPELIR